MATASVMSFLFLVICLANFENSVFGLRCRVEHDEETQQSFQDIVRTCMNADFRKEETGYHDNHNSNHNSNHNPNHNPNHNRPRPGNNMNNNNWQHGNNGPQWAGIPRFPTKDTRDRTNREDEEDENNNNQNNNNQNNNGRNNNRGFGNGRGSGSRPRARRAAGMGTTPRVANDTFARRVAEGSPLEEVEPCVIHCIFRQMQMLGQDNEPDRGAVERAMTSRLRDRRLRDFIREAISECFDTLEQENQDMKCSTSKSFALCLEQKGQQNCEDWDDEIKRPSRPKHGGINPNKHRG